jgi:hypothetical protein
MGRRNIGEYDRMPEERPESQRPHPPHVYWRRRAVLGGGLAFVGYETLRALGLVTGTGLRKAALPPASTTTTTKITMPPRTTAPPSGDARNIIQIENSKPGWKDFAFPFEDNVEGMIEGYCNLDSARRGDIVRLFVSTTGTSYTIEAFRFGHYGGAGARRVWAAPGPIPGSVQAPPFIDPDTNMRECGWVPSYDVTIGYDWTPGMYLFRLRSNDGGGHFIPLVVLDDRHADLLVISAITTWNAYNTWGGASLYDGDGGRSKVVSFDRPYDSSGSGHFFGGEYEFVQQVESMGIDVTYTTDIDLHARPEQTTAHNYKAIVSLAHDEYYSLEMRQALESARDAGVNLIFLGANAVFRRIRLEPSPNGPHRREVNYRVPEEDPLNGVDDARVTSSWRYGPGANPEASLVGDYYESNPIDADMVVVNAGSWVFDGTGLNNGDVLPGLVGNEYDRVTPEAPGTPPNIEVMCHSPAVVRGKNTFADVTYYTAPSGAGVFATGTLWWEQHCGPLITSLTDPNSVDEVVDFRVRRITANVLNVFLSGPAGKRHPSVSNLDALGIFPNYIADPPGG